MDNKASFVTLLVVSLILLSSAGFGVDAKRFDRHYRLNHQTGVFERDSRAVVQDAPRGDLEINSVLESRFATTTLGMSVTNVATTDQELPFIVQVPYSAFITYFSLEVNGKLFVGTVVERSEAEQIYEDAKNQNKTAGMVEGVTGPPSTQTFAISANVGAGLNAKFTLIYKMLLTRKLGKYEYLLYIPTNISSLAIDASVYEPSGLYSFQSPSHNNDLTIVSNSTWGRATYGLGNTANPLSSPIVLRYEVGAMSDAGKQSVGEQQFLRALLFASNLPTLPKSVILIIDVSGSMGGNKIDQARSAASTFISWLSSEDKFNIISFSSGVTSWQSSPVPASDNNKNQGKQFIAGLQADGGTNINAALVQAMSSINNGFSSSYLPVIVFLTDGEATEGETNSDTIRSNVRNANVNGVSIFCLGFGYSLNYELLRSISAENNGFDRRIIDDESAQSQLEAFFAEINKPIMSSVVINYNPNQSTKDVTQNSFNFLFEGSEIIVTGRIASAVNAVDILVTGSTKNGAVEYKKNVPVTNTTQLNTEVIWAYWTIQELVAQYDIQNSLGNGVEANATRTRATQMALDYQFVTPFTSMIVVANDTNTRPPVISKPTDPNSGPGILNSAYSSANSQHQAMSFGVVSFIALALFWIAM